ncbi:MAG: hypothetical protein A3E37_03000 [Candidatus Andersenbacteria bacterium RIFCSPHIGHO2_12_FULL_46_9]|nr:MAG: hypothetical protein UW94_C0018G0012 [Parcubacteria group bacterium GW2011_GWA2_45_14]OGY35546.1 MAG: hypothetical protein A3E37_03000 [Candidatus Andersenbacteria bacterium RIFCSPHIGHO2_12_FULL_46_9]OGY35833.1 MAG: hypothetical protein A3B76_05120 [Candidatus Andersenbacteria bacterium RIFCSPHIGHO2_02_FULL_46_16]OGY38333.1 MAG: hypothetical protein A3I08_03735 [Candidatus Andersenbacteria bacterium RIFCSPLOWO2_02_FULL_46_11]OGY39806.1 MAG: hypothetical protein A3G57_02925 [Candidatus A
MKQALAEAQFFTIPGGTQGWLYPAGPGNAFSIAVVTMDGVYPQRGWSINDVCTETMYVQTGRLKVEIEEETFVLKKGDVLSILPRKKYRVRGKAATIDVITPAWNKKQNHII